MQSIEERFIESLQEFTIFSQIDNFLGIPLPFLIINASLAFALVFTDGVFFAATYALITFWLLRAAHKSDKSAIIVQIETIGSIPDLWTAAPAIPKQLNEEERT